MARGLLPGVTDPTAHGDHLDGQSPVTIRVGGKSARKAHLQITWKKCSRDERVHEITQASFIKIKSEENWQGSRGNYRVFPVKTIWNILGNFLRRKFTVPLLKRKKSPHKSSQPCKRHRHKGRVSGAERGGWAGATSAASPPQACARRPALPEMPLLTRTRHRVLARTQGASLAHPGLQRSLDCTAPGATPRRPGLRLHFCPSAGSAAAAARVAGARPVLTCAPSAEQRAESSGAGARHPRGGPCSGGGRLHSLGC